MRKIYESRDFDDYSERISELKRNFKVESVCDFKESNGITEAEVYHLSNGLTLMIQKNHFSNGNLYYMFATGDTTKVSQVEKIVNEPLKKESSSK